MPHATCLHVVTLLLVSIVIPCNFRHQKYFGKIRYILNDVNQPKRIIVGTEDNVIGAINSNTGQFQ